MPPNLREGRLFPDVSVYVVSGKNDVHVKINHNYNIRSDCDFFKEGCGKWKKYRQIIVCLFIGFLLYILPITCYNISYGEGGIYFS